MLVPVNSSGGRPDESAELTQLLGMVQDSDAVAPAAAVVAVVAGNAGAEPAGAELVAHPPSTINIKQLLAQAGISLRVMLSFH